jgi:Ca2+-binding RTX toxin-like protein
MITTSPLAQALERRVLLASTAPTFAAVLEGNLIVVGTKNDDQITVRRDAKHHSTLLVTRNGQTMRFNRDLVDQILITGMRGNDNMKVDVSEACTLVGGGGNDTLTGGSLDDNLVGGSGDDLLAPRGGSHDIVGGGGKDVVDFGDQQVRIKSTGFWLSGGDITGIWGDSPEIQVLRTAVIYTTKNGGHTRTLTLGPDVVVPQGQLTLRTGDAPDTVHNELKFALTLDLGGDHDRCTASKGMTLLGGAGNDKLDFDPYSSLPGMIDGGDGNDTITGEMDDLDAYQLTINGGAGQDSLDLTLDPSGSSPSPVFYLPEQLEDVLVNVARNPLAVLIIGNDLDNKILILRRHDLVTPADSISGGAGNDYLLAAGGDDSLDGGAGDDTLNGGWGGADFLRGGDGHDTADYSGRTDPLNISLNNQPDDGAAGETDNVWSNVETVLGGHAGDRIIGNPFANKLLGNDGDDTLYGGAGNDTLDGGPGRDHLFAQEGNDLLLAKDNRRDTLDGGIGDDTATVDATTDATDALTAVEHVA